MAEEQADLIFVAGNLRRGLPEAVTLADVEYVAEGLLSGVLYDVGGSPCLMPGGGAGYVTGDLYRGGGEALLKAILDHDARAAVLNRDGNFRIAEVKVYPGNLGQRPVPARTWEWTGEQDGRKVSRGDWVDWVSPRAAPWCTWIAAVCLLNGLVSSAMMFYGSLLSSRPSYVLGIYLILMSVLSPPSGLVAFWLGRRRREKHREFRRILFPILAIFSIPALIVPLVWQSVLFD